VRQQWSIYSGEIGYLGKSWLQNFEKNRNPIGFSRRPRVLSDFRVTFQIYATQMTLQRLFCAAVMVDGGEILLLTT
jgi:hypothetical protein